MCILAYDPYLSPAQIQERGATPARLDELLRQSDFVTIHCPYNAKTKDMLGQRELALMPPHAYL